MRNNHRSGFTLLETLITMAIIVAIGVFVTINLLGQKNSSDLIGTASQIVASLRQVQIDSATQSENTVWGIHFANATTTHPFYAVFAGSSYASGTVQGRYPLSSSIAYITSTLPVGSSTDVTFSQISGVSSISTTIGLYVISSPSLTEYISISNSGKIGDSGAFSLSSCSGKPGAWSTATALPTAIFSEPAVVNNNYAYSIGGYANGNPISTVYYTPINSNGTLGAWSTATALPVAIYNEPAVVNNNYVYLMGGYTNGNPTSTVYYTLINGNGTLSAWSTATALPTAIFSEPAVVNNNYAYLMGGYTNGNPTSTVSYAPINSNGTLGAWSTTTALPAAIFDQPAVVNNNYAYLIGGYTNISPTSTVYYAPINSNGTLGAWSTTTAVPVAIYNEPAVVNNNYIYLIGGYTNGNPTSTVSYAPINSNGTLGAWSTATALPAGIFSEPAVVNNNYAYSIGGIVSVAGTSTVYYASLCQ